MCSPIYRSCTAVYQIKSKKKITERSNEKEIDEKGKTETERRFNNVWLN